MGEIKENGVWQRDLVIYLGNVLTLANEMKTDLIAVKADLENIQAKQVSLHLKLDQDGGITDTDYVASLVPTTLTVTTIAASDLSLTV